jgi:hypothetical protein
MDVMKEITVEEMATLEKRLRGAEAENEFLLQEIDERDKRIAALELGHRTLLSIGVDDRAYYWEHFKAMQGRIKVLAEENEVLHEAAEELGCLVREAGRSRTIRLVGALYLPPAVPEWAAE